MAPPLDIQIDRVNRAFKKAGDTLAKEKGPLLKRAAEPIRVDAEILAVARISNITLPWARFRIGVTKKAVYIAPKKRGARILERRRPNMADLLREQAMEPALEKNRKLVEEELDGLLTAIARAFEMAQKLTVTIVGDDRDLQQKLNRSQTAMTKFGDKVTADAAAQSKGLKQVTKAEDDLFKLRARRAASVGPFRLAGIGLGAGTALFAGVQAVRALSDALKVTGEEAFTAQGKMRNFTSSIATGDLVGGLAALTAVPKTLEEAGISATEATTHYAAFKAVISSGFEGPLAGIAEQAVKLAESVRAAETATNALADATARLGTAFRTSTGEAVTFKGAVDDIAGPRGPGGVDQINTNLQANQFPKFGLPTGKPIGPGARLTARLTIALAGGDLDEILRLQTVERDRTKKAFDNSTGNVKQRTALNQKLAVENASIITTKKAIADRDKNTKETADLARKTRIADHWSKIIENLSLGVSAAELTAPVTDDIKALKALKRGYQQQAAAGVDVVAALNGIITVNGQIADKTKEAHDKALDITQGKQFRAIGLSATGSDIIPTAKNLQKQLGPLLEHALAEDLPAKITNRFAGIRKVLAGQFGKLTPETRTKIQEFFQMVRGEFDKENQKGPLTKTTSLNANRLLEGLGLGRDAEKQLRARLSGVNSAGRQLAGNRRPTGQFATAQPVTEIHTTVELDGQVVGQSVTRHQQKTRRRNPPQKRGPNRNI